MADYKNYDELLKQYEPKQEPKKAPQKPADSKPATRSTRGVSVQRSIDLFDEETVGKGVPVGKSSKKPTPPPVTNDRNNFKGGVYFSNHPTKKNGNKASADSKPSQQNKGENNPNARRKANVKGKKKAPKNAFVRFITSKGMKRFAIMAAVIAVVSTILCIYAIGCIDDVLGFTDEVVTVEVTIEQGMTDDEVIDLLEEKGLINNKLFCKIFIGFFEKEGPYISNTYTLSNDMGVERMIALMKTDYTLGDVVRVVFPEGSTVQQMAEHLEEEGVCTASAFINTLKTVDFSEDYEFITSIDNQDQRYYALEGYLYPDTYDFYMGENPTSVVKKFLDNFEAKWTEEYQERADELGLTMDEVITLASIIQAEAANDDQMPGVSSVIHNRLNNSYTFPKLECDSTTAYYTKYIAPHFSNTSADMNTMELYQNRYDTYDNDCIGLPVGPISNPGNAAISAALYPSDTGYYFFNHDVNGGIYYAVTAAEHDRNVAIAESVLPE